MSARPFLAARHRRPVVLLAAVLAAIAAACRPHASPFAVPDAPPEVSIATRGHGVYVRWAAVAHATGYHLYLGIDAPPTTSTFDDEEIHPASDSDSTIGNLNPGHVYWVIVTARFGSSEGPASQPVGAATTNYLYPVSAAWSLDGANANAHLGRAVALVDLDGDGLDDAAIGEPGFDGNAGAGVGRVRIFPGRTFGLAPDPAIELEGSVPAMGLGSALAPVGSIDGDPFDDLAIGAPSVPPGSVEIVFGGISPGIPQILPAPAGAVAFGSALAGVREHGDTTSLGVGDPGANAGDGRVSLVRAGDGAVLATIDSSSPGAAFGSALATSMDAAGDGELLVGAPGNESGKGTARLFAVVGTAATSTWFADGDNTGDAFGSAVAFVPDANGDTFEEIAVGSPHALIDQDGGTPDAGRVSIFGGAASGFPSNPDAVLENRGQNAEFGTAIASANLDADDHPELLVGAPFDSATGGVKGGETYAFNAQSSYYSFGGVDEWGTSVTNAALGSALAVGDVNGDGFDDVLVGAPDDASGGSGAGHVELLLGGDPNALSISLAGPVSGTAGVPVEIPAAAFDDIAQPHACAVDYGDGSGAVTIPECAPGPLTLSHVWPDAGTWYVVLSVTAADGRQASAVTRVVVTP